MKRKYFKPGDRVRNKNNDKIMYVSKYIYKKHPILGKFLSDYDVECVWYEDGVRKTGIFDQRTLLRIKGKQAKFFNFNKFQVT
jgi:uncharacterized protein YodC (DUF2158 family)